MQPNQPPQPRRIEIVPLDDRTAPGRPLPTPTTRLLPSWPPPAVRTTVHPAPSTTLPTDVVIDLTSLVPTTAARHLDLTAPSVEPVPALTAAVATPVTGLLALGARRERLQALLASERAELEQHAQVVPIRPPVIADPAPFPLPRPNDPHAADAPAVVAAAAAAATTDTEPAVLRRVPKAVRPDAEVRPLSNDVAAAIHRLTGRDLPSTPARRIEIVPLGDPAPLAPVVHLLQPVPANPPTPPAEIDLRDEPAGERRPAALTCPACQATGQLDIVDHITHVAHYSCGSCFRMWTESLDDDR